MNEPVSILMVDDSYEGALLVKRFAKRAAVANPVVHMDSGRKAIEYLTAAGADLPGCILLDVNMPGMTGHETLAEIRASDDPAIRRIPIIFLTTSSSKEDLVPAYDGHANSYIVKPKDGATFQQMLSSLAQYWFDIVYRPPKP
ncbi:response regulator [Candidatus Nanopelagicales bacterium]|nr:response regulator [Candidatus Nanopelagicales bacterium]